jgi:hypothetical protein
MIRRELYVDGRGTVLDGRRVEAGDYSDERGPAWGGLGAYWCSHCSSWRSPECGAHDAHERVIGPVCDDCVARLADVEERRFDRRVAA